MEKQDLIKVLRSESLRNAEKLVLIYLMISSAQGQCSYKNDQLAVMTGLSRIAVSKAMQHLSESGMIQRSITINPNASGGIERMIVINYENFL